MEIRCGFAQEGGGGQREGTQHGELNTGSLVLLLLEGREREGLVL